MSRVAAGWEQRRKRIMFREPTLVLAELAEKCARNVDFQRNYKLKMLIGLTPFR